MKLMNATGETVHLYFGSRKMPSLSIYNQFAVRVEYELIPTGLGVGVEIDHSDESNMEVHSNRPLATLSLEVGEDVFDVPLTYVKFKGLVGLPAPKADVGYLVTQEVGMAGEALDRQDLYVVHALEDTELSRGKHGLHVRSIGRVR